MGMRQGLGRGAAAPSSCCPVRHPLRSTSSAAPCRRSLKSPGAGVVAADPHAQGLLTDIHSYTSSSSSSSSRCQRRRSSRRRTSRSVAAQAVAADLLTFKWDEYEPNAAGRNPQQQQQQQQQPVQEHEVGSASASSSRYDPVCVTRTVTLPTVTSWPAAVSALSAALHQQAAPLAALPAACLRLEVGLPLQRSTSALRWLLGQPAAGTHQVYFSQRHSTAPDTPGAVAAAAASAGWTSLAGQGAAWEWQGSPGAELGAAAVSSCRRFLSESSPRVRVLGGGRFDPQQAPAEEWASFGSYCFVLPQLEVTEADQVLLLAVTAAWDDRYMGAGSGLGPSSAVAAVAQATAALSALAPPATLSAPLPPSCPQPPTHTPDQAAWEDTMAALLGRLADSAGLGSPAAALAQLDRGLAQQEFLAGGQQGLDDLLAALGDPAALPSASSSSSSNGNGSSSEQPLTKVVLARRSAFNLPTSSSRSSGEGGAGPTTSSGQPLGLLLLEALQARDPRAYQLYLSTPEGACFLGSTPERLYARSGAALAGEAVAGTRPRGPPGDVAADFYLGLDLLQSDKDHVEFSLVRNWIHSQLAPLCGQLEVEVTKSVIKMAAVQHLYGRLAGTLAPGAGDGDLLAALHPTPAVCGRPREAAMRYLADTEGFDRGLYSGPFGWMSGGGAEFVVAIRSALLPPPQQQQQQQQQDGGAISSPSQVLAYAGVGVVPGSVAAAEWEELNLKVRQYANLLAPRPALAQLPNRNAAAAALLVEEACRAGVTTFCVAPGSRSSPLALAAARHPRVSLTVGIDERSLGFWALGAARAAGRPVAVITSSGTAVANLLPAVVEASQSGVPLLLLTADRPAELRATGANQTIDQVKLFGSFTRWAADVPPPSDAVPGRALLTTLDTALRYATAAHPGPVHLNLQFQEPLAPAAAPWDPQAYTAGLGPWLAGASPFSGPGGVVGHPGSAGFSSGALCELPGGAGFSAEVLGLLPQLRAARRGLLVVGELMDARDAADALALGVALGWPVVTDVLSGLRVGLQQAAGDAWPACCSQQEGSSSRRGACLVHHMDLLLLGEASWWGALQPDVVVQLGRHLTSKRLAQFLEWSALGGTSGEASTMWVSLEPTPERHDPAHLITQRLPFTPGQLLAALNSTHPQGGISSSKSTPQQQQQQAPSAAYAQLLVALDRVASAQAAASLAALPVMSEMAVAATLAAALPPCHALFLGNSMPIRDMDAFGGPQLGGATSSTSSSSGGGCHVLPPAVPPGAWLQPASASREVTVGTVSEGDTDISSSSSGSSGWEALSSEGVVLGSLPAGGVMGTSLSNSSNSSSSSSSHSAAAAAAAADRPASQLGVPIAANRGASGIDGVLSSAAGFAAGLRRPVTLVVGDLSFLHDVNGLGLLRGGEMAPPLTVLLVNNGGGGIFSFLPVAGAVDRDAFERLWGTPQAVDLEALCRAHGIPHQKVAAPGDLRPALATAWGLNRHSVVEVTTDRSANLGLHRQVQREVAGAVAAAYRQLTAAAPGAALAHQPQVWSAGLPPVPLAPSLSIAAAGVSEYALPLARPVTTGDGSATRRGWLLQVTLCDAAGRCYSGVGEAAPLPGLHSAQEVAGAGQQLVLISQLLKGLPLPRTVALCCGAGGLPGVQAWLRQVVGVDPRALWPSVGCAVEGALLGALAAASGSTLAQLLVSSSSSSSMPATGTSSTDGSSSGAREVGTQPAGSVQVAGLLPGSGPVEEVVAAAHALVAGGATTLKLKVGRRPSPAEDAEVVLALRQALGPRVVLRADANRAWDLGQAVAWGRLVAGLGLEWVEEPCADAADLLAFWQETGMRVALDETLDEGALLLPGQEAWASQAGRVTLGGAAASAGEVPRTGAGLAPPAAVWLTQSSDEEEGAGRREALAALVAGGGCGALVVKPSLLGSLQGVAAAGPWAATQGLQLVVSSSFESGVGLSALANLAAAVDSVASVSNSSSSSRQFQEGVSHAAYGAEVGRLSPAASWAHGLGTLPWLAQDVVTPGLAQLCPSACGGSLRLEAAQQVLEAAAQGSQAVGQASSRSSENCNDKQAGSTGQHAPVGNGIRSNDTGSTSISSDADTGKEGSVSAASQQAHPGAAQCWQLTQAWEAVQVTVQVPHQQLPQQQVQVRVSGRLYQPPAAHASCSSTDGRVAAAPLVLLHGFMGSAADWHPLAAAAAADGRPVLAVDLPGHGATQVLADSSSSSNVPGSGGSRWQQQQREGVGQVLDPGAMTLEVAAHAVAAAVDSLWGAQQPVVIMGYSLGARVAAALATYHLAPQQQMHTPGSPLLQLAGVVLVSGSPGLEAAAARAGRAAADDALARALVAGGQSAFTRSWYAGPLWRSLRAHPAGQRLVAARSMPQQDCATEQLEAASYAAALSGMSTGRMDPLWSRLAGLPVPLLLVSGQLDRKFTASNARLAQLAEVRAEKHEQGRGTAGLAISSSSSSGKRVMMGVVPDAGHALHVEAPVQLRAMLQQWYADLEEAE